MESFRLIDTKISSQAQGLTLGGEGKENARKLALDLEFVWHLSFPRGFCIKTFLTLLSIDHIILSGYFLIRSLITTDAATAPKTAGR